MKTNCNHKRPRKTRYCIHHHNCDRDEDCMAGEYCPFGEGSFVTMAKSGKGKITIGTQYGLADQAAKVVHESIEAILTEDDKRFYNYTNSHERANFMFIFDHDYLCQLEHKIIDALLTSGFFSLKDGKK